MSFTTVRASRRRNVASARVVMALLVLAPLGSCVKSESAEGPKPPFTVVSYGGGAYRDSQDEAFLKPFSLITGNKVESVVWNADYGKLKTMVASGEVPWDVVEVTEAQVARGVKDGLLVPLAIRPDSSTFAPNTVTPYGVGAIFWATVLTYSDEVFPRVKPSNWRDFWNVKKFPGDRALYDDPRGNLEIALLADGVSAQHLYPLDVERAFRKLSELRPHIRVWWRDSSEPLQLLSNRTVSLATAWNGRVFAANRAGAHFGMSWSGAVLELNWWVIPKGSRNTDLASRFIYFASVPSFLATQATLVGYGPANMLALEYVPNEVARLLPTYPENLSQSLRINSDWWSANEDAMKTRWIQWKNQ